MNMRLMSSFPKLGLLGPLLVHAQNVAAQVASAASGASTQGRPPIVEWSVVVGVSAVVAAVVAYAVAKSVTSGTNSNN